MKTLVSENLPRKCYLIGGFRVQFELLGDSKRSLLRCFITKFYANVTFKYKYNHSKIGLQALML